MAILTLDTLAIPISLKNSPGFTKLRSQISEIKFLHDVIGKILHNIT